MRAHLPGGDQQPGRLHPNCNVQQTVAVEMTEFAPLLLDELNSAESVNFQTNPRQAEGCTFQPLHRNNPRSVKYAGAREQKGVKKLRQPWNSRYPSEIMNYKMEHKTSLLKRQFRSPTDVFHHPQMNGAENVPRPKIEIPNGPDMQRVPGAADQRRGSVGVGQQDKLAAMGRQMID